MLLLHHNDLDGRAAAAVIKKAHPDVRCFEVHYDMDLPIDQIEQGEEVVIVDFTPPTAEEFKSIVDKAGGEDNVTWLDHHGANIKAHTALNKKLPGKRVESVPSGAMLAWEHYFPKQKPPMAVVYTSDFDTWTHDYPESKLFEAGMSSLDYSPGAEVWDKLLNPMRTATATMDGFLNVASEGMEDVEEVIQRGRVVQDFRKQWYKGYLSDYGFETEFEGHKAIVCNIAHCGSDFFASYEGDAKLMIPFAYNGEVWACSIYSEDDSIDCAALAKKHGGGGHKGASGFSSKEFPFK